MTTRVRSDPTTSPCKVQRLVEQQLQQPPPGYVVQRRESIHVGSCTSDAEEAKSAANFELRTVSLTSSESLQIRQFRELRFCSGCRLWDSGVALARWLCNDKEVLHDKEVLELGSGLVEGRVAEVDEEREDRREVDAVDERSDHLCRKRTSVG